MAIGKDDIEEWLDSFLPKLKRRTNRTNESLLILSIEQQFFEDDDYALIWDEIIIEDGSNEFQLKNESRISTKTFVASEYQKELISNIFNERFREEEEKLGYNKKIIINRSELVEEDDEWALGWGLEKEYEGGEAILFFHKFEEEDVEVAIRVQCFNPALFTDNFPIENIIPEINLHMDFATTTLYEEDEAETIPKHRNVIKHFANIELFHRQDREKTARECLGWITIMEKGEINLFNYIQEKNIGIEERKNILKGILSGWNYLYSIGIAHCDMKLENIVLVDDDGEMVPKIIDFGLCWDTGTQEVNQGFRKMGYIRQGSKYRVQEARLDAGTPGFCIGTQIHDGYHKRAAWMNLAVFLLCEWKTAWFLLYEPLDLDETAKKKFHECKNLDVDDGVMDFPRFYNLFQSEVFVSSAYINAIDKIKDIFTVIFQEELWSAPHESRASIVIRNSLSEDISEWNRVGPIVAGGYVGTYSELCVPLAVCSLFHHAITSLKEDINSERGENLFTYDNILRTFIMICCPRLFGGLGYRDDGIQNSFDIEGALEHLTMKTHLLEEGWRIISRQLLPHRIQADYDIGFSQVDLTSSKISKTHFPLTATVLYRSSDGIMTHQLILEKIENGYFVLTIRTDQDSNVDMSIRIPARGRFFLNSEDEVEDFLEQDITAFQSDPSSIEQETWYIFPIAYFLTISKIDKKPLEENIKKFNSASIQLLSSVYTKRFSNYNVDPMPFLLDCLERTEAFDWESVIFEINSDFITVTLPSAIRKYIRLTPLMKEIIKDLEMRNCQNLYGKAFTRKECKKVQSFLLIETIKDIVETEVESQKWETAHFFEYNQEFYLDIRGEDGTAQFLLTEEQAQVFNDYREEIERKDILSSKLIGVGGEGLVIKAQVDGTEYGAKVHLFDQSILSHGKRVTDYIIDTDIFDDPQNDLAEHRNIIKHVANSRIFHKDDTDRSDCLGWITFMPKMKSNLWRSLKKNELRVEERINIARAIFEGKRFLLEEYRILHTDLKLSNLLVTSKNSSIKIGDFGLSVGQGDDVSGSYQIRRSKKESVWTRKLGYRRSQEKFLNEERLQIGTPGFTYSKTLNNRPVAVSPFRRLLIFLTCEWFTAWNINFFTAIPLETIKSNFHQCGLDFEIFLAPIRVASGKIDLLKMQYGKSRDPHMSRMRMIQEVSKMNQVVQISLDTAEEPFTISENTARSINVVKLQGDFSRCSTVVFRNFTNHPMDQKTSELCVPISVINLLRLAIEKRLKEFCGREEVSSLMEFYSFDFLLKTLLFHIYPRNFAGLDCSASPREKYKSQQRVKNVEKLLCRLEETNFMFCIPARSGENNEVVYHFYEGWKQLLLLIKDHEIIRNSKLIFSYQTLNENFVFTRPLTVSACYIFEDEDGKLHENNHQLLLDCVESGRYIFQNTSVDPDFPEMTSRLAIPRNRPYYVNQEFLNLNDHIRQDNYRYFDRANGIFMKLVNLHESHCKIETNKWYLYPRAYSIHIIDNNTYV